MPADVSRSIETSPTLFRLRTLRGTGDGRTVKTAMKRPRRRSPAGSDANAGQETLRLRIEPPHAKRARRLVDSIADTMAPREGAACAQATSAAPQDLFTDHAGDLIARLGQWSLQLDRREAELDRRQRELNQLLRLLRQCPQAE
ncbi:hypothetical protein Mal15_34980 [Stieleria maiorica]|uniref:Uncharacterized protein n=1 Tax=Stieleria maiorica TaxID=2795974 RepID=A0A5B9MF38_9BACT|nr:hypothetical protein [Stieleria maiorica]QEF99433.1 hypothetical protein Mal15_34980 [Stieleria maiorica]